MKWWSLETSASADQTMVKVTIEKFCSCLELWKGCVLAGIFSMVCHDRPLIIVIFTSPVFADGRRPAFSTFYGVSHICSKRTEYSFSTYVSRFSEWLTLILFKSVRFESVYFGHRKCYIHCRVGPSIRRVSQGKPYLAIPHWSLTDPFDWSDRSLNGC